MLFWGLPRNIISDAKRGMIMKNIKPLGRKNYGSIGHLPNSRMGPADHKITEGQERIATIKPRDKHDTVIVQEKLDGSNVGVALLNGVIYALSRAGYEANTSPYEMHHIYNNWVYENEDRFRSILNEGERICGEWLTHAHGTKYALSHEPFIAFDLIDKNNNRAIYSEFRRRVEPAFNMPHEVSIGVPIRVIDVMDILGKYGHHGALEEIEGAVWRVERKGKVDFLCKYVRPDKIDGKYLSENLLNTWV